MTNITHVIFDLDGLILDTEILYDKAIQNILDEYKIIYTYEVKSSIMGMKYERAMEKLRVALNVPMTTEELVTKSLDQLHDLFLNCSLKPGAERLIKHLSAHAVPMCIATGSSSQDFKLKTSSHQALISLMEFAVRSDDPEVKHGKPNPDIFLVAMKRFKNTPTDSGNCLVLEDAPNGVHAALAAGMKCVMVPDPRLKQIPPATEVLQSLEQFVPEKYGLPKY